MGTNPALAPAADPRHAVRQIRKDLFISALALVSVGIGLYNATHARTSAAFSVLDWIDLAIVGVFIVEFAVSAYQSGDAAAYARRHWYELPSLLPITGNMGTGAGAASVLRGLRLVRLVRVLRLVRLIGMAVRMRRFWTVAWRIARRAHLPGLAASAAAIVFGGAGLAWIFEAQANPAFRGGQCIWWALNMFTNVAYVDFQPETTGGRVVAGILEFTGIGFIGLFTASLASALVTDKEEPPEPTRAPLE